MSEANIPIGWCHKCKKDVPVQIQEWGKKENGKERVEIELAYCPFCEMALNVAERYEIKRYITEKELDEMMAAEGYSKEEPPCK